MPSLDLHVVTSTGNTATALTNSGGTGNIATIAPGGDGATVAGLPIDTVPGHATLVQWGASTTIADTIEDVQFFAQDQWDNVNGEWFTPGATSVVGLYLKETQLTYQRGKRVISMQQNTGAANNNGFLTDYYPDPKVVTARGTYIPQNCVVRTMTAGSGGGALTANTWGTTPWAPAAIPPDGQYILLGCYVGSLTNYGYVRFSHNDFGPYSPGFPVIDQNDTAVANAVLPKNHFLVNQGVQFVALSDYLNAPVCPVFHIKSGNTGLNVETLSITADTPKVTLVIQATGGQ